MVTSSLRLYPVHLWSNPQNKEQICLSLGPQFGPMTDPHGWERERKEVWWEDPQQWVIPCRGDGQRPVTVGQVGGAVLRKREILRAVHLIMAMVTPLLGWWGVAGHDSEADQIFLLAPGPTDSKTTIPRDGAFSRIRGDTWFPVVLALRGKAGCTFVLERIQWLLSQQAPRGCGSRSRGISETYLCLLAEKQSKTSPHLRDGRKCGQLSLSTKGGEATMKGHWLFLMKRHRNCWFKA